MRRVGEHRGVSMVSGAGNRAAGSPGDVQETKVESSPVNRLRTDDGASMEHLDVWLLLPQKVELLVSWYLLSP